MDFTWKITLIWKEEKVGQNDMPKLTFVVEEVEKQYPSSIAIDLIKDKTKMIEKFAVGDVVTVSMNFRTNEYKGRHFTSINAWKMNSWDGWKASTPAQTSDDSLLPF